MASMCEDLERRRHHRQPREQRDVGYVFHSVAVAVAHREALATGARMRVRAGRHGGWVAEPAVSEVPC